MRKLLHACVATLAVSLLAGCSPADPHPNDRPCQDFFDALNEMTYDLEGPVDQPEAEWRAQVEKDLAWMKRAQDGATGDVRKSIKEILSVFPELFDNKRDQALNDRFDAGIENLRDACIATGFNPSSGRRDG